MSTATKPAGAFYMFPDVSEFLSPYGLRTSSDLANALLNEARVALTPGEAFDAPGFLRISYATSMKELERGLDRTGPEGVAVLGGARLTNEAAYTWVKLAKGVIGTDSVDCQMDDGLPAEAVVGLPRATIAVGYEYIDSGEPPTDKNHDPLPVIHTLDSSKPPPPIWQRARPAPRHTRRASRSRARAARRSTSSSSARPPPASGCGPSPPRCWHL